MSPVSMRPCRVLAYGRNADIYGSVRRTVFDDMHPLSYPDIYLLTGNLPLALADKPTDPTYSTLSSDDGSLGGGFLKIAGVSLTGSITILAFCFVSLTAHGSLEKWITEALCFFGLESTPPLSSSSIDKTRLGFKPKKASRVFSRFTLATLSSGSSLSSSIRIGAGVDPIREQWFAWSLAICIASTKSYRQHLYSQPKGSLSIDFWRSFLLYHRPEQQTCTRPSPLLIASTISNDSSSQTLTIRKSTIISWSSRLAPCQPEKIIEHHSRASFCTECPGCCELIRVSSIVSDADYGGVADNE